MPHATLPSPGFQAFILCGPGASLDTFTSNPAEFPKAIIPIANRPMVWYPLDWCYRMGITNITLITPPESKKAIENAMATNPHLTSLPLPRASVLAPTDISMTSGTGEVFRQPEVVKAVEEDFIILPCDLVSELEGTTLVQEWMVQQVGSQSSIADLHGDSHEGEAIDSRGALGMWYDTTGEDAIKKEETDFIMTAPPKKPITPQPTSSIQQATSQLLTAMPTDSFKDLVEARKSYQLRYAALRQFGRVNIRTSYRDSHVYFFPQWAIRFMQNERYDSIGEDVVGWWAKSTWQPGLAEKLGLRNILQRGASQQSKGDVYDDSVEPLDEVDTSAVDYSSTITQTRTRESVRSEVTLAQGQVEAPLSVPPILAYVHSSITSGPLIKRVDTTKALLAVSLKIAKLPAASIAEKGTVVSPLAHPQKIAHPDNIPKMTRVEADTCLLAENVTIGEKCGIKESVIGAGCTIGTGVKLTKCLLMEDVMVGDNVTLTNCVLGRRCKVEGGPRKGDERTELDECEIQGGFVVAWGSKFNSTPSFDDR
jgi:translation initiation factor eIF-2B subunit gamma